jgi:hypothetical protein
LCRVASDRGSARRLKRRGTKATEFQSSATFLCLSQPSQPKDRVAQVRSVLFSFFDTTQRLEKKGKKIPGLHSEDWGFNLQHPSQSYPRRPLREEYPGRFSDSRLFLILAPSYPSARSGQWISQVSSPITAAGPSLTPPRHGVTEFPPLDINENLVLFQVIQIPPVIHNRFKHKFILQQNIYRCKGL